MTKHQKIIGAPNLNRRSFIVGTAATGLVLGYAAFPDVRESLAATPAHFEPTAWYAIGNDGKIVVTVGKAEMGQHISSTMAQLIAEELEASWKDMGLALASSFARWRRRGPSGRSKALWTTSRTRPARTPSTCG
jgi:isoquinoline 1-oxidoreductase subunit beta